MQSSAPKKSGGGGAKLSRTETVTVRLDPKLNYLCELGARSQRRTKSSFIEWAVAEVLATVTLPEVVEHVDFDDVRSVTLKERASQLWHIDEADRVVALALHAPALLTHEEQVVWKLIRENGYLWKGKHSTSGEWTWSTTDETLIRDRLRSRWDNFVAVARGEKPESTLPSWTKNRELDDDVPF